MAMSQTPTTCTRCGRPLRSPAAVAARLGRTCARRIREVTASAADLVKADALAKALEDIEDGALIDTRYVTKAGRRVFAAVSSDGTHTYLAVAGGTCNCRAGRSGRQCRHAVAAALLAA